MTNGVADNDGVELYKLFHSRHANIILYYQISFTDYRMRGCTVFVIVDISFSHFVIFE